VHPVGFYCANTCIHIHTHTHTHMHTHSYTHTHTHTCTHTHTHMYTLGCKIYYRKQHAMCCDIPQWPAWSLFPHFQGLFIFQWFSPSYGHSCERNYGYCPPFHDINSQRFGVWICLRLQLQLRKGRSYSVNPLEGARPGT